MNTASGTLFVVATPIGNLEDMTHRAVRVLREVDVIAAEDTRTAANLLRHFDIPAHGRLVSLFEGNEVGRTQALVSRLLSGESLAVISEAGTPGISDPGEHLIAAAIEAGLRVEPVPGASAVVAALVASGLSTARFTFLGFPPRDAGPRRELFGSLRTDPATFVLYEAPDRVGTTLSDLKDAFGASRRGVIARELTKMYEEHVRGTLSELSERFANESPRGECTIVVEGADPTQREPIVDLDVLVRELLEQGLGPRDIAARLVVTTGKPKRALYQLALSLKREKP